MKKKTLSFFLAVIMVLALVPVGVWAADDGGDLTGPDMDTEEILTDPETYEQTLDAFLKDILK